MGRRASAESAASRAIKVNCIRSLSRRCREWSVAHAVQSFIRTLDRMEVRMNRRVMSGAVAACGFAVVLSAACSDRNGTRTATNDAAADAGSARPPVTLTGCLQKGDLESEYVLTEVNHSRTNVGTSGSKAPAAGDAVGREQMREAARAYRLSGEKDVLEPLVGKQVRVTGTEEKRSTLNEHSADRDRDRAKIDDDDLARVRVASIDQVSEECGVQSGARPKR